MKKLSTGQDSTLKQWRRNCVALFGADSPQVRFIDKKIKESPRGEDEEVETDEVQLLAVFYQMEGILKEIL